MTSEPVTLAPTADPQQIAADPTLSAFVTANAGSGKTKTLIDRVARLLLAGAAPQAILCVTYTKAAAAEMQRRLFGVLGEWSVLPDAELAQRLRRLNAPSHELSKARALFARALETPGGLKIQTIHAFCEKLLRRFPLEAGVSPAFRVMDDAAAAAVALEARARVARHALAGEGVVAEAYARFSVALDFQAFQKMFADFEARRTALSGFFETVDGLSGAIAWTWRTCGFAAPCDPDELAADAMARLDRDLWARAARVLSEGGKQDQTRAAKMAAVAEGQQTGLDAALGVLFIADGGAATWIQTVAVLAPHPALRTLLLAEQARLAAVRDAIQAATVAWDTVYALTLAQAYLTAYAQEKGFTDALDFADLITRARALIRDRPSAAWVLYKLDGGIDHVLVDEAQDTAAEQWEIIRALTAEFFSGAGVRAERTLERQLFVVGDEKQSIYSFQGARPERLAEEYALHRARAEGAGVRFEPVALLTSYRSTPEVLAFVDAVFAPPLLARAIQPRVGDQAVQHVAVRLNDRGCVDLWEPEVEAKGIERDAWDAPLDAEPEDGANRRLARRIAGEIQALITRGDAIYDKDLDVDGSQGGWRAAEAGDVLILVRRRGALFTEILRALKQAGVPVAGADRLALSEHIVFDDLLALARFALFPKDDLTLAALLKSPLCGLDDDDLFELAFGRSELSLWDRLQVRADERPAWRNALGVLVRALDLSRSHPPFEFYSAILNRIGPDGRSLRWQVLKRLGGEAREALDEYLAQVLAAEGRGVHTLEGLAHAFASLDIIVKREMDAATGEVRVMTAHGAKGLEAPIVFLPETTTYRTGHGSPLLETEDGGFLWCAAQARDCEASATARARRAKREEDEAYRLLYVALTRARDRLVLCGRVAATVKLETLRGWWGALVDALAHASIADQVRSVAADGFSFQRFGHDPQPMALTARQGPASATLPAWIATQAPVEAFARYASPSDLGDGARVAAPSPLSAAGGLGRFRRGELVHRLLQILPDLPPTGWRAGAAALLAREADLDDSQRTDISVAALTVMSDPQFAEVFGPGSRPEIAIAGTAAALPPGLRISGRIDRLVVLADRVLVVDFKTNRPSPNRIEDADPVYLRQMALYAALLGEIFPGRRIEAALVWTDGPKLMGVPEFLIARTLAELRHVA